MATLHQFQHSWLPSLTQKPNSLFPSKISPSPFKVSLSLNPSNSEPAKPTSQNPPEIQPEPEPGPVDPVKLAFEKAKAYKKSIEEVKRTKLEQNSVEGSIGNNGKDKEVPVSVKVAMEKAKEYKKNKGIGSGGDGDVYGSTETETNSGKGLEGGNGGNLWSGSGEKSASKKEKLSISSIDFVGLNFADKKTGRGLPPGLVPIADPFPEGDLPEVEIIVGDTSKFGDSTTSMPKPSQEDNSELYKPKVSTWGVFPRPGNISKTVS